MTVKGFLALARSQLAVVRPLRFVTGNQSADLDSIVCAITYAYLQYNLDQELIVPLINIPKKDFRLRRDIELLLKSHSITEDNLFFLEDFKKATATTNADLVLVDHCNVQGDIFTELINEGRLKVVGIVDHHEDEKEFLDANPRIVRSTGSCSSLVFNYWNTQYKNAGSVLNNTEVVSLLLGPLLMDTSNMSFKVEEPDTVAFKDYEEILSKHQNGFINFLAKSEEKQTYDDFYKKLKKAKKDLAGFSFGDILRKDYKQFTFVNGPSQKKVVVGFSSLGKSFDWILTQYSTEEMVQTFRHAEVDLKLDILVMTPSYTRSENDQYTREFAYHYKDATFSTLGELATAPLELDSDIYKKEEISLKISEIDHSEPFVVYNQRKLAASRKQVVPVVKEIIETHKFLL